MTYHLNLLNYQKLKGFMMIDSSTVDLEHFTSEGWEYLLEKEEHKEIAINSLSQILTIYKRVEFKYNDTFYEIFESCSNDGYIVNIYSSSLKDENGDYFDINIIDGGLCTGNSKDAIEFMM